MTMLWILCCMFYEKRLSKLAYSVLLPLTLDDFVYVSQRNLAFLSFQNVGGSMGRAMGVIAPLVL